MSGSGTGSASRIPSGSSTRSGPHSPSGSPNTSQSQRKLPQSAMFGVAMSSSGGMKGLNPGWEVWNAANPASKRNASISSSASITDLSSAQSDNNYRGNLSETWNPTRTASGSSWDITSTTNDPTGSPQKRDLSQMDVHSQNHSLSFNHARQRQATAAQAAALSVPRIDERAKPGQYSQRFDSSGSKDSNVPSRYPNATSPTKAANFGLASSPFTTQHPSLHGSNPSGSYDQTSVSVDTELSLGLRGLVVEDDFGVGQQSSPLRAQTANPQLSGGTAAPTSLPQIRVPPTPQQPRAHYNTYGQTDYTAYYTGPSGPLDYQYAYDSYRTTPDPSLFGSPAIGPGPSPGAMYPGVSPQSLHLDVHRQGSVYYDYSVSPRPGSQYYYPTQPMVYHPPPAHSPMLAAQIPNAVLHNKKRDLQPQNFMYGSMRSTPSPHPQAYAAALDYASQLPMMLPGNPIYGHVGMGHQPLHIYQQGIRAVIRRNDGNESVMTLRSPLLDEFRALNKTRKWELRDIFGYVVEFSGDQHGSRFIQQKLESATSEEKQIIFDEIVPDNALQLIQDVFGNYVVQKLFEHGTQVQKTVLANTMEGHVLTLSLQMYGCRVVQKAIEYVLPEQQSIFVKELETHVLKCVKDANGNHVIQKLIERVSPDRLGFVESFRGNVYDLSTHPYGCRVLQRCFEHLPDEQTRPLLDELHKYTVNLMQDQFGNYVIQFVLEHGKPRDRMLIVAKLRGQILHMARHKFASNVCEKALICADPETRRVLIDEMMTPKQDGVSPIVTMMKDQFANYVLQRALTIVEGEQKESLISKIKPQLVSMRRYSSAYSKHLISIERLLEKSAPPPRSAEHHQVTDSNTASFAEDHSHTQILDLI